MLIAEMGSPRCREEEEEEEEEEEGRRRRRRRGPREIGSLLSKGLALRLTALVVWQRLATA